METKSRLFGEFIVLRAWQPDDLQPLLRIANNPRVAANMRNAFPHPYTAADGHDWLDLALNDLAETAWAVTVGGELAGGIGLLPQTDINTGSAEIGYWLGEPFWGRGFATDAVRTLTSHALSQLGYRRLFATVFANNVASCRVLEKSGYVREGVMRRSAIKNGVIVDQVLFARLPTDA